MRFLSILGNIKRSVRAISSSDSASEADVTKPEKLAELLRKTMARITNLEVKGFPDVYEVEMDVASNTTYRVYHGLGNSVRYWPTSWIPSSFFSPEPVFYTDTTVSLEKDYISLKAVNAGRVVLRFEASDAQVTFP